MTRTIELDPWHGTVLKLLNDLASLYTMRVIPHIDVYFTEEIRPKKTRKAGYEVTIAGMTRIQSNEIWLKLNEPLYSDGIEVHGKPRSYGSELRKLKPKMRQGEQYFLTLLHEIGHLRMLSGTEIQVDRWAFEEFKKQRKLIRSWLKEESGPSFMSKAALLE